MPHLPRPIRLLLAGFLLVIPIVCFGYLWREYAISVPKWDDHALKAFLYYTDQETTFSGKLYQLVRQHNEHRIVYDRIITWLDYNLFGKLSYVRLMAVGNLSLLGLLILFGLILQKSQLGEKGDYWLYLPPIAYFLFNLSQWENMLWGMAALQNFTVILWVLGSIYALTFTRTLGWAFFLAAMATLTSGNGLTIWPIGIVLLLFQRRFRPATYWGIGAVVTIGLYFIGYHNPEGNPPARGSLLDLLKGWFAFLGAAAEAFPVGNPFTSALLVGALLTITVLIISIRLLLRQVQGKTLASLELFFLGSIAFILGTGLIVAWSRVGFGMETLITSRYKVYSLVLISVLYVYAVVFAGNVLKPVVRPLGLIFGVLLALFSYTAFKDDAMSLRHYLTTIQFNWTYSGIKPTPKLDDVTAKYLGSAPAFYDHCLADIFNPNASTLTQTTQLQKNGSELHWETNNGPAPTRQDEGCYVIFRSDKRLYMFPTSPKVHSGLKAGLGLAPRFDPGFTFHLPESEMEPGTYQIGLLTYLNGNCQVQQSSQAVTIAPQKQQQFQKNW